MRCCGSRFGRDWVRPGGLRFGLTPALVADLQKTLRQLAADVGECNALSAESRTVQHRFKGAGIVTTAEAREIGLVGMHARLRHRHGHAHAAARSRLQPVPGSIGVVEPTGDCWARMMLRIHEMDESLKWSSRCSSATPKPRRAAHRSRRSRPTRWPSP